MPSLSDPTNDLPPGWLSDEEAAWLAAAACGRDVLEIGAFLGRSTVAMARTARLVVSIDHHRGSVEHQPCGQDAGFGSWIVDPNDVTQIDTARLFLENLSLFGVRDRVVPMIGRSSTVLPLLRGSVFDLAFIDASHDEASVYADAMAACALLRASGHLVFHDTTDMRFPGVRRAVERVSESLHLPIRSGAGSLAVLPVVTNRWAGVTV